MARTEELILYRNFAHDEIVADMCRISGGTGGREDPKAVFYRCAGKLAQNASIYGFEGNLWHTHLAFLLASGENAYSTACEIAGPAKGSVNELALHDFAIIKELFDFDLETIAGRLGADCLPAIRDYKNADGSGRVFGRSVRDCICELAVTLAAAKTAKDFRAAVTEFYRHYGVGELGLHKAFRVGRAGERPVIVPINRIAHVTLDDLVGYEIPKKKLIENTEAFVMGRKANNCLLFGDAGTGKSTSVKAVLNQYYDRGLRMIEIYKHQFRDLNEIIGQIKNRNYKFIIYMDDLSFEEFEIEYKYLKAVIEGGLERKPDNVLIYATSNRRHLVREQFSDKEGRRDDLHASDTVQEKLSLVARFGVSIFFVGPGKKEFDNIVLTLARRNGIAMPDDELLLAANRWELEHGGRSGRTAQQFVDYLLGKE